MNAFLDVHVLQTVPPANLNRDDAGSPKQALFGGVRRARVSSQAWKRATRKHFAADPPGGEDPATRTNRVSKLLSSKLAELGVDGDLARRAGDYLVKASGVSVDEKAQKKKKPDTYLATSYLLFVGRAQIDRIASRANEQLPAGRADLSDDELKNALAGVSLADGLKSGHPAEVALFGRMVADLADLNVDAAVQVAHAISTHAVETEFDYFTAVDDEKDRTAGDDLGAGMIGTVEFNSATLYRYATLGLRQLIENLDGAADTVAGAAVRFVDGFVRSMPTGHQTTFAHRTLPDAVVLVLRTDQPVNLVSAFEQPVRPGRGFAEESLARLARTYTEGILHWGGEPSLVGATYRLPRSESDHDVAVAAFGDPMPFGDLLRAADSAVRDRLAVLTP